MAARKPRAGEAADGVLTFDLADESETAALAARLAPLLRRGDVVTLSGDLGSGKTSFARALLRALGHRGEVPSPTFTLAQVYDVAPCPLWHLDLYRLTAADEALEIGIEEALAEAITLIEWPEVAGALLPAGRLDIRFDFAASETVRRVTLTGRGDWLRRLAALAGSGR